MKSNAITTILVSLPLAHAILSGPSISHAYGPSATHPLNPQPTCSPSYTCPKINDATVQPRYVQDHDYSLIVNCQFDWSLVTIKEHTTSGRVADPSSLTVTAKTNAATAQEEETPALDSLINPTRTVKVDAHAKEDSSTSRFGIQLNCDYDGVTGKLYSNDPDGVCPQTAELLPCDPQPAKRYIPREWATREQKIRLVRRKIPIDDAKKTFGVPT